MAIVQMQKVAILGMNSDREELIQTLHEAGMLEVSESHEVVEIDHTAVDFRAADLVFAISVLKAHASKETQSAAARKATVEDVIHAAQHTDVRGIVEELRKLEEADTNANRRIQELRQLKEQLTPWLSLPFQLDASRESQTTVRICGTLPEVNAAKLQSVLKEELPRTEVESANTVKGTVYVCAVVWKEDQERFEEHSTTLGWTSVDLPSLSGTVSSLYEEASVEIGTLQQQIKKNNEKRAQASVDLPNVMKAQTYLKWLSEKQSVREAMSETERTITLLGWMPKKEMDHLESKLQKVSHAVALMKVKPDEGEEVPVALRNPNAIAPFESVTTLYGLPLASESDPTLALAPFFILFFALCLTDAGYGLVLAAIFGTVIAKKKLKIQDSKLVWLLFIGGIVTFIVSIFFGGWWGLDAVAIEKIAPFLTKPGPEGSTYFRGQIWNLNAQSGVNFLQNLSLVLGMTHLFFGMFLAGMHKWIHGKKMAAFWLDFTSHLLLGGTIFYAVAPENLKQIAFYTFIATLVIFIWGKGYGSPWFVRPFVGALGLLNFAIGLLSNGLSYLRILALGLVTGAIAMAVNQVAVEMGKLFPIWVAIPVIIVIFLLGHLVSIALNVLGSFIHSGRLQFIEFFSQFFEGGGRTFTPFRRSTS